MSLHIYPTPYSRGSLKRGLDCALFNNACRIAWPASTPTTPASFSRSSLQGPRRAGGVASGQVGENCDLLHTFKPPLHSCPCIRWAGQGEAMAAGVNLKPVGAGTVIFLRSPANFAKSFLRGSGRAG